MLKRSTLVAFMLAALALSGATVAATVTSSTPLPEGIANFDIANASTQVGILPMLSVNVLSSDNIVGRTTGFAIRVTLNNGALFNNFVATAGPALAPLGWTVTVVGGYVGTNTAIINFNPPSTSPVPGIVPGDIVDITGANAEINPTTGTFVSNLAALQTSGQTVGATVQFFDPVSTNPILNTITQSLLISGNPVVQVCIPNGNQNERIDVGQDAAHASRTYFSSTGGIGMLDTGQFNAGYINYGAAPGFGYFQFNPTDQFTTTLQGAYTAFNQAGATAMLRDNSSCGPAPSTVVGAFSNGNGTLTFQYTASQMFPINGGSFSTGSLYTNICFAVPSNNTIPLQATPVVPQTVFTRNGISVNVPSCALQPMQYNAPVVRVYTFNPAGNTTQDSFLRVSDTGPAGGQVIITGVDDAGHPGVGPVSFSLAAGQSVQLESSCLTNGSNCPAGVPITGALGTGTGKWRLTVVSYFPNLVVTSLNRNNASGTVSNLTDYDVQGKQAAWSKYGDNGAGSGGGGRGKGGGS
ncbi:hypothetical protein B1806_03795 [Metallibacterium scheffleri]|uniref:P/Homo B domain-containing protein n=2 Tax=Metallibacterium scheffleri TaxID=993689 RepID=A0A4S3KR57_9GAMM|nr:hypothetical protein B1806_03795 [Metallibacterium scheffleri]